MHPRSNRARPVQPVLSLLAAIGLLAGTAANALAQDDVFAPATPPTQPAGQPEGQPDSPPDSEQAAPAREPAVTIDALLKNTNKMAPGPRLGIRAHLLREAQQVPDTVIIVSNAADAARAIGSWGGLTRFPVLIDDGSVLATENIARFCRAFKPGSVLRFDPPQPEPWPNDLAASAKKIVESLGNTLDRSGSLQTMRDVLLKMRDTGIGPNGVVVIDPGDPAWIAGLALAAGRAQVVSFAELPGRVNGHMETGELRQLTETVQQQLEVIGSDWEKLGDEIDSITIVGNGALRANLGLDGKDVKAVTDLVGRHRSGIGNRWAWSGAIFGDSQSALYRVMCGLFLPSDSAWLFDGYGRGDPWDLYDATSAARELEKTGYTTQVYDTPSNRVRDWRTAVARGVDADLALINSRGNMSFFQLGDGKAICGDIPLLETPIAVHLVHSWSSRVPNSPRTVAGRWLEHGAYLFYGSVDEPFLNAFVQTPAVANRLMAGLPWGVACRQDSGPPWKLNVLGDPQVTFVAKSRAGARLRGTVNFEGATPFADLITEALKSEDYPAALRYLTMAGRDTDAARLASALLRDRPEKVGNDAALWMVLPLYRAGRDEAFATAYNRVDPERQATLLLQDALWHAGRRVLASGPDTQFEGLMRRNLREWEAEYDAVELAAHISSRAGPREAVAFLEGVAPTIDNDNRRKIVTDAINRFGGPSRP